MSTRQESRADGGREKEAPGRVAMQCVASATGTFIGQALGPTLAGKLITGLLGAGIGAFLTASGGRHHRRIVAVALLVALLNLLRRASDAVASEGRRTQSAWVPTNWAVVGLTALTGFAVGSGVTTATNGWGEDRSPALASIPEVHREAREDALRILEDAGFRVTSANEPSTAVAEGAATRTDPPARARIDAGASVMLFVSTGPPPVRVKVPKVAGQPRTEALARLRDSGLRPRSRKESSDSIDNGVASRTDPPAGATVGRNTRVTLFVSSGPAVRPVTVPDVTGRRKATALAALTDAGLSPTAATEPSDSAEEGIAVRTDPPAGAEVDRGAAVRLFVSSGAVPATLTVPELTGYPEGKALVILRDQKLDPTSDTEPSESVREGTVTRTDPAAGANVEEGSGIAVFVSSGPPPAECDDGIDNDGDQKIDSVGIDNDGDGRFDVPADPECKSTQGRSESGG
jgi:beta-lactam-binding protein with PASTA domain